MTRTIYRAVVRRLSRPLPTRARAVLLAAFLPAVVLAAVADYGPSWDAAVAALSAAATAWVGTAVITSIARRADTSREEIS